MDAMLRHLGAAYYDSLHGKATGADVARAMDTVEAHLNGTDDGSRSAAEQHDRQRGGRPAEGTHLAHGWSRRVGDVMTTKVVTVDRITPYKEIATVLAKHHISGVPVLRMGRKVVGVVTEADLLEEQVGAARRLRPHPRWFWWPGDSRQPALTAGELMTSPAVTVRPDATVGAAARLMTEHHLRRLPVTDESGKLAGIVSRRDLIAMFLRSDADIATDVRRVLEDLLPAGPGRPAVAVHAGVVVLTGTPRPAEGAGADLIPVLIRLVWDVDGVVNVVIHPAAEEGGQRDAAADNALRAQPVPPDAIPRQAASTAAPNPPAAAG